PLQDVFTETITDLLVPIKYTPKRKKPQKIRANKNLRRFSRLPTAVVSSESLRSGISRFRISIFFGNVVGPVGHLGEAYEEWVHQPIVTKEGPRFFQSDFWEFLTLTVWWAIPVIWLPVVVWCISMSVSMGRSLPEIVSMVALGIFIWTFIEYTLHRFLFHIKTKSYWGNTAHYLLHGCHHKHPMDHLRLVFPPTATAILCFPVCILIIYTVPPLYLFSQINLKPSSFLVSHQFWNLVKLFATPSTTPALFGGGLLGYVMYDVTHYYLHHAQPTRPVTKNLKKYHLNHHFRIQDKGFGITSSLWDIVFGTLPTTKAPKREQ
ncbi:hypothetical protein EUTSA_v10017638mg, partial [Eutrema salsugineum]